MAVIGVEGVEIRVYKAEEPILTLTTDVEGRADTMLEANTYRVEYWFENRKIGEHDITLEVDSYVVWSFPAVLMAIIRKLAIAVEVVEVKLGDVVKSLPLTVEIVEAKLTDVTQTLLLTVEVEARIIPEFYPSLTLTIEAKLGDIIAEEKPLQTVDVKLGSTTTS